MIFQQSGRRGMQEKWDLNGESIEVVNRFKYLGLVLTPKLSMDAHLKERLASSKGGINGAWHKFVSSTDVPASAKYRVFGAVSRAVMLYGAQVWGYKEYVEVEKLLRFFVKKLFRLPRHSPNYMIYLETGLDPLFINTLKLHFDYILRSLSLPVGRLPRFFAEIIIREQILWARSWIELAKRCQYDFPASFNNIKILKDQLCTLHLSLRRQVRLEYECEARASTSRVIYSKLNYDLGSLNYFNDSNSLAKISTLFKTRGEMLSLGFQPHVRDTVCSLCNLSEREDIYHFLSICPILKTIRLFFFGKSRLGFEETLVILDGDWERIFQYACKAVAYRLKILNEDF